MRLYPPHPSLSSRLTGVTQQLQVRMQEVVGDVTSGRRSDQIGFLKGDIGQAMLAQRAYDSLALEKEQIALRTSRLAITQRSLENVAAAPQGISLNVLDAIETGNETALGQASDAAVVALERIFTSLNTRHGERHLFSGDATDTRALASPRQLLADLEAIAQSATSSSDFEAQVDTYFNSPGGGWRTTIYQGTGTTSHPDQVLATDAALTELVSGLAVVALHGQGNTVPDDAPSQDNLKSAAGRVMAGADDVTALRARVGLIEADLEGRRIAIESEERFTTELLNALTARDPYEAALELRQLETNLETAYALTARLSQLSLTSFLR